MSIIPGLYEGTVRHERRSPREHRFASSIALCFLDLDAVPETFSRHPLWSTVRSAPVHFRREDYLDEPAVPLATRARAIVAAATGLDPGGAVGLVAHVRTWGWCFNPLSLYFCYGPDGTLPRAVVASVTNTPWGERHNYVLPTKADGSVDASVEKEMHVSPFLGMDQRYRFRISSPAERLQANVDAIEDGKIVLAAEMSLTRRPLDAAAMTRLLVRYPMMTARVSGTIYAQAARLLAKHVPVHAHPARVREET